MRELTYVEAAREALAEEMERDPTIFVVGEGIGARGGNFNTTVGLFDKYGPKRLRDTPISERGFTNMCTGAAITGSRPVVDWMFYDFGVDAMGDLIHQTATLQWMSGGRLKVPILWSRAQFQDNQGLASNVILISWKYGKLVQDEIDRVILGITRPSFSMVVSSIDK